ncbi:hypothetical protein F5Y18DRAFT_21011 [Xylariaceae sp. FL1019]|nr:hypothetical protein F5Y18DRAFT_21011 [Xylariaceae sp. FL1019]
MKSVSVAAAAAVLAGVAVAQPHGNHLHQRLHAKREIVTTWETVWETVTVIVDDETTSTVLPTTTSGAPGEFFQPSTTTSTSISSTSTSTSEVVVAETPTSKKAAPTTPTTTSTPPPPPSTTSTSSTWTTLSTSSTFSSSSSSSSSTPVVEPITTSIAPSPSTTSSEPAATTTASSGGSGGGKEYSGEITYYAVGLGACGYDDSGKDNSMPIVAIAVGDWGAYGTMATNAGIDMPLNPWCGKELTITANGKTVKGQARDQCPGCASGSIDVSEQIFKELFDGDLGVGRSDVTWTVSG